MRSLIEHVRECGNAGAFPGVPCCVQHDLHRVVGWSRQTGLYFDDQMVRAIGYIDEPEKESEWSEIRERADEFWLRKSVVSDDVKCDLATRLGLNSSDAFPTLKIETSVLWHKNIAAAAYPEFFCELSEHVDKDGLVDFRFLASRMTEIQPGIYHEQKRDVLLFAHPFYRRSLSRKNKLNAQFLESLSKTAAAYPDLRVRIRLDPDVVGYPDTLKTLIELEYWRGPKYTDDISEIPSGVAEHKADDRTRYAEGIDRIQVWWKSPESRLVGGQQKHTYRTFELEELVENPAMGLSEDQFGCRYAHAEFSEETSSISHFDGALRVYGDQHYLDRIEKSIDRAGKHAGYFKLFRFDGNLPVHEWKALLTEFFRGNPLIPEYFGETPEIGKAQSDSAHPFEVPEYAFAFPSLVAFASVASGCAQVSGVRLFLDKHFLVGNQPVPCFETCAGKVSDFLVAEYGLDSVPTFVTNDRILNLSRVAFPKAEDGQALFNKFCRAFSEVLFSDFEGNNLDYAAIPLVWEEEGVLITLTIAGETKAVSSMMRKLPELMSIGSDFCECVQPISDFIRNEFGGQSAPLLWNGSDSGILEFPRMSASQGQCIVSVELWTQLGLELPPTQV